MPIFIIIERDHYFYKIIFIYIFIAFLTNVLYYRFWLVGTLLISLDSIYSTIAIINIILELKFSSYNLSLIKFQS
jgi:hypothetical protein